MDPFILLGIVLAFGGVFGIQQRSNRWRNRQILALQQRLVDLELWTETAQKERAMLVAINEKEHEAARTDMQAVRRIVRRNLATTTAMQEQIAGLSDQLNTIVMAAVSSAFALRQRGTPREDAMTYIETLNTGGGGAAVGGTVQDQRRNEPPRSGDPPRPLEMRGPP